MGKRKGQLQGLRVLVTNGGKQIGGEISEALARLGARVALVHEGDLEIQSRGGHVRSDEVHAIEMDDLCSDVGCVDAVRLAVEHLGGIDIVINNMPSSAPDNMLGLSEQSLAEAFCANVFPLFHLVSAVLPELERSPAAGIIHTSWQAGYGSSTHRRNVSEGKDFVKTMTQSLARQLESRAIRVNAVALKRWPMGQEENSLNLRHRRGGDLDIASNSSGWSECEECYVFLANPSHRHVNGQVIQPNFGRFLKG